jgi:hypothetical protein
MWSEDEDYKRWQREERERARRLAEWHDPNKLAAEVREYRGPRRGARRNRASPDVVLSVALVRLLHRRAAGRGGTEAPGRGDYSSEIDAALPPLSVAPVPRRWVRTYGDAYAVPA